MSYLFNSSHVISCSRCECTWHECRATFASRWRSRQCMSGMYPRSQKKFSLWLVSSNLLSFTQSSPPFKKQ